MVSVNNPVKTTINYSYDNAIITPLNAMEANGIDIIIDGKTYPGYSSSTDYTANSSGYMMFRVCMLNPNSVSGGHTINFYDISAGDSTSLRVCIYSFYLSIGGWIDIGPFPVQAGHTYRLKLDGIKGSFQIGTSVSKVSKVSHLCFYKG